MGLDEDAERVLLRAFPGCRVDACRELSGGISARALVAELALPEGTRKRVVLRRPTRETAASAGASVTAEHALLGRCRALGLLVPEPHFVDREAGAVVLEYVDGAPELPRIPSEGMLRQMATELARIHRVPLGDDFRFLNRRTESAAQNVLKTPAKLDGALGEAEVRAVLLKLWPFTQRNSDVLLHCDYWPGNLLWRDQRLVAVIDWEESEIGDPLADVALTRLDLWWAFGEAAMHAFTEYYRAENAIDWSHLAHWELVIALRPMSNLHRWAPAYAGPPISRPDITESSMGEDHRRFVAQALCALERGVDE
jgi:aminoglycoside phosphotransferase (APT) family kinase protein